MENISICKTCEQSFCKECSHDDNYCLTDCKPPTLLKEDQDYVISTDTY